MAEPASLTGKLYGNLRLLRVYLARVLSGPEAVFEIFIRGNQVARLAVPAKVLGLPREGSEWVEDCGGDRIEVPAYLKRSFAAALDNNEAAGEPVWVAIDRPTGFLPAVAWERALRPELKMPLLRLPHLPLKPFMPRNYLDIGVCFAVPDGDNVEGIVAAVLGAIPADLASAVRLHVFANPPISEICRNLRLRGRTTIAVHAPGEAEAQPEAAPSRYAAELTNISNPWLLWICEVLKQTSLDSVQFVATGSLMGEQGRLQFVPLAGDPVQTISSNAREISAFLEQTGAWSLALISTSAGESGVGMRMLQDQVAWISPTPIYITDLDLASGAPSHPSDLEQANRFILGAARVPIPVADGLTLMCHPKGAVQPSFLEKAADWLSYYDLGRRVIGAIANTHLGMQATQKLLDQVVASSEIRKLIDQYTLANRLLATLSSAENPPAWLASAQRTLERSLAHLGEIESDSVRQAGMKALAATAGWVSARANEAVKDSDGKQNKHFVKG
jgi:hypothetical protein